jgi:L-rhamnose isomerase
MSRRVEAAYRIAKDRYAELGVDTEEVLQKLSDVAISLHCWQGDDVRGFENINSEVSGGIAITGDYQGRARDGDELRQDLDMVFSLLPGSHRLSLHAMYLEAEKGVPRNEIEPQHFKSWLDWARQNQHGVDFNPTCFSHPLAESGFTLAHRDPAIRQFWVEHCIASRRIADWFGRELGCKAVNNIWIPDGFKDTPADRLTPRQLLLESLDAVLKEDFQNVLDAVESKLFGIGSESYVAGSLDFYNSYAVSRGIVLTLDMGHFHPTESIADKISSLLLYLDRLVLHISRGVRWDSDHVVVVDDETRAVMREIVRCRALERVHIGLDYFDASINRLAAWVIGARSTLRALLDALLEPTALLVGAEAEGDFTRRLALQEAIKTMPSGAVWDYYCLQEGVPVGLVFMDKILGYERNVLIHR